MPWPPLSVVFTWPAPNWRDPITTGDTFYVVTGIFLSAATLAVAARLYSRIFIRRFFGWDDALVCAGYLVNVGNYVNLSYAHVHYQWDRHVWDTHLEFLSASLKSLFIAKFLWCTASALIRLSLLVFFHRLLNHVDLQRFRPVIYVNIALVLGIWFSYSFTIIFSCVPVRAYWAWPPIYDARCIDEGLVNTVMSSINTFSEFIVASLPVPVVFRVLPMRPKQRWSVICLLSLGYLVCLAGCVRTYYVWRAYYSFDPNWWASAHWSCSEVELDVALICACAPALRPFVGRAFTRHKRASPTRPPRYDKPKRTSSALTTFTSQFSNPFSRKTKFSEKDALESVSSGSTYMYKQYDLEGIRADGYGYTVSITANPDGPTKLRKKSLARKLEDGTTWGGHTGLSALKSVFTSEGRSASDTSEKSGRGGSSALQNRGASGHDDANSGVIAVTTTKDLEVRHSYNKELDPMSRGWDYRNPFVRPGQHVGRLSKEFGSPPAWDQSSQELLNGADHLDSYVTLQDEGNLMGSRKVSHDLFEKIDPALTNSRTKITNSPFNHNTSAFRDSTSTLDSMEDTTIPGDVEKKRPITRERELTKSDQRLAEQTEKVVEEADIPIYRPGSATAGNRAWTMAPPMPTSTAAAAASRSATTTPTFSRGRSSPSPHRSPASVTSPINSSHQWVFNSQSLANNTNNAILRSDPIRKATQASSSTKGGAAATASGLGINNQNTNTTVENSENKSQAKKSRQKEELQKRDTVNLGRAVEDLFARAWDSLGQAEELTDSERAAAEAFERRDLRAAGRGKRRPSTDQTQRRGKVDGHDDEGFSGERRYFEGR